MFKFRETPDLRGTWLWSLVLIIAALGCEESETAGYLGPGTDSDVGADPDEDTDVDGNADSDGDTNMGDGTGPNPAGECAIVNETRLCCDGNGVQTCGDDFAWSECDCADEAGQTSDPDSILEGNQNTDISFEWEETEPTMGSCEPGRYEGQFAGIYDDTPVTGIDLLGGPGIVFNLTAEGNGEVYTINGGKFRGTAIVVFPFSATMTGSLDCATGKFEGNVVDGQYNEFGDIHHFEGVLKANYNRIDHAMVNGTWNLHEPDNPGTTGKGTWKAKWVP